MATHSLDSCLQDPHRQRILGCNSPWNHQESDMTEHEHTHTQPYQFVDFQRTFICVGHAIS